MSAAAAAVINDAAAIHQRVLETAAAARDATHAVIALRTRRETQRLAARPGTGDGATLEAALCAAERELHRRLADEHAACDALMLVRPRLAAALVAARDSRAPMPTALAPPAPPRRGIEQLLLRQVALNRELMLAARRQDDFAADVHARCAALRARAETLLRARPDRAQTLYDTAQRVRAEVSADARRRVAARAGYNYTRALAEDIAEVLARDTAAGEDARALRMVVRDCAELNDTGAPCDTRVRDFTLETLLALPAFVQHALHDCASHLRKRRRLLMDAPVAAAAAPRARRRRPPPPPPRPRARPPRPAARQR